MYKNYLVFMLCFHYSVIEAGIVSVPINVAETISGLNVGIEDLKLNSESQMCRKSLEIVFHGLKNKYEWALKLSDSWGRTESGIYFGNLARLGNFDECLEVTGTEIKSQYCLTNLEITVNNQLPFRNIEVENVGTIPQPSVNHSSAVLQWGVCMPLDCDSKSITSLLNEAIKHQISTNSTTNVVIHPENCKNLEALQISSADGVFIAICGIFILLVAVSTICDIILGDKLRAKNSIAINTFLCNSLILNGSQLLSTKSPKMLNLLNGMRSISVLWIILGSRYRYTGQIPLINQVEYESIFYTSSKVIVLNSPLAFDTFFLLSGILNTVSVMKILDKSEAFPFVKYYVQRYVRLTIAYAIVIGFYATWFNHLGSGPLWNEVIGTQKKQCERNWWSSLLYINNYVNPLNECVDQSWYLAADMQIYFLAPLIIYPIWKWQKIAKYVLPISIIASACVPFTVAYLGKIKSPEPLRESIEIQRKQMAEFFLATHNRFTPYIIGISFGYLLHLNSRKKINLLFSGWKIAAGWIISTVFCTLPLYTVVPLYDIYHKYNAIESSSYMLYYHVMWSFGVVWIIKASLGDYGGPPNFLLSWKGFIPLSRLTYSLFLVHGACQLYQVGSIRQAGVFQDFVQVHQFFGDLLICLVAALGLHLIFEAPVASVDKLLMKKVNKSI